MPVPSHEVFAAATGRRWPARAARMVLVAASLATAGCAVSLHGYETTGSGGSAVMTSSAVVASASSGNAWVGARFGTPVGPGAPGGTVSFSRGASGVLFLGVLFGEVLGLFGAPERQPGPVPDENISRTCSCYGWKPDLTLPAPGQ